MLPYVLDFWSFFKCLVALILFLEDLGSSYTFMEKIQQKLRNPYKKFYFV